MTFHQFSKTGLECVLDGFEQRFVSDQQGRLCAAKVEGVLPRFVLGRAAEGCVWRFSAALPASLVRSVAKLAGREKGSRIAGELTAPPERLVMMSRLLRTEEGVPQARREFIRHKGVLVGEIWMLD